MMKRYMLGLCFVTWLALTSVSQATIYYVAPTGAGTACTTGSPCSLNTGLNGAQAGDDVVLKNGVYQQYVVTIRNGGVSNPITIRAENTHLATLLNLGTAGSEETVRIKHNYITLRGVVIDGNKLGEDAIFILSVYGGGGQIISGVIIEDNRILDSGGVALHVQGVNGVIIRNNFINGTGYNGAVGAVGEAFYLSIADAAQTWASVENVEIYGNTVQDTTNNMVDYKRIASGVNVHHNIFENHVLRSAHVTNPAGADDGMIRSEGNDAASGNKFEDNIVRNSQSSYIMRFSGNRVDAKDNVFYNLTANSYLSQTNSPGAPMEITGNTFCNTPSNLGSNVVAEDVTLSNNIFNQAQSVCNTVEARILSEMSTLFPLTTETYYAGPAGSDSNSCTAAQTASTPKLTITAGAGCLSAGDTLIVKAGTYQESLINVIPSGTSGAPTIVKSEVQHGAIINTNAAGNANWCTICITNRSYITLDGLVLDGTGQTHMAHVYLNGTTDHIVIQNNKMRYGEASPQTVESPMGIADNHGASYITVRGNIIHDIATGAVTGSAWYGYGMSTHFTNSVIENNEIYNCAGHGMHFYNTVSGDENNNIIRNNKIHHNGIPSGQHGVLYADGGANNQLYGNVIYSNGAAGVAVGGYGVASTNNIIYNNTMHANSGPCIRVGSLYGGPSGTLITNNICYQNGYNSVEIVNGSGTVETTNLFSGNPLFVNSATANFHLQTGSPAIGTGTDTNSINPTDHVGVAYTLPKDMGAYDFIAMVNPIVLVFTIPPVTTVEDATMPLVRVCVDDTAGVRQTAFTENISVALVGTGVLTGGTGGAPTSGCRAFPGLSVDTVGADNRLVASAAGVDDVTSGFFNVIALPTYPTLLRLNRVP